MGNASYRLSPALMIGRNRAKLSMRQSDALQQLLEAGVGSEIVCTRRDVQQDKSAVAPMIGTFHYFERAINFP